MDCRPSRLLCPWDFLAKNTRVGRYFLLQGIFLTQRSNPCLLHWQANSLLLSDYVSCGEVQSHSISWSFVFVQVFPPRTFFLIFWNFIVFFLGDICFHPLDLKLSGHLNPMDRRMMCTDGSVLWYLSFLRTESCDWGYMFWPYRKGGFPGKVRVLLLKDTQNIGLIKLEMSTP